MNQRRNSLEMYIYVYTHTLYEVVGDLFHNSVLNFIKINVTHTIFDAYNTCNAYYIPFVH